ncbi:MAG: hypothetical protein IKQ43_05610 [Treponema sp.]|nr:hypothetical protein [Treponema sp.]
MDYCIIDSKSGKPVDFDFKPVEEAKKAVWRSREDAFYFLDCFIRESSAQELDSDAINKGRAQFTVQELA